MHPNTSAHISWELGSTQPMTQPLFSENNTCNTPTYIYAKFFTAVTELYSHHIACLIVIYVKDAETIKSSICHRFTSSLIGTL